MIDNFKLIRSHLVFNNKDEFYFVQIIQRKKDGNEGLHVRNGYRLIRSYYIYSVEEFNNLESRIKELCESNNARAYINLNVRNAKEAALECIKRYSDLVLNNNAFQGNNIWDSVCGSTRARSYKALWVVDVDNPDKVELILRLILSCRHTDSFTFLKIPTIHGFHIVCNGFDINQFNSLLTDNDLDMIDVHKNNPTLLYYNDLSSKQEQGTIQSNEIPTN